jgi:hypothetical protein
VLLYLAPDKVQAVHLHGWRQHVSGTQQLPVAAKSANDWQAVLEAGLRLVQLLKPQSVRVVLSDQLVRYFPLPWRADLRNDEEELAFAKLAFDEIHGADSSADWHMTLSSDAPGLTRLGAAVTEDLLSGLKAGLTKTGLTLTSVRPQLVAAIQVFSRMLPKTGWVLSHEPGRLSIAGWNSAGWHWVSSSRISADTPEHLLARLQQELMLAGAWPASALAPTPVYVCAPTLTQHDWRAPTGLQLITWQIPKGTQITEPIRLEYGHALIGVPA